MTMHLTDKNILVMHINMEAGHSGASGRFDSLKEVARDYSFIIDLPTCDLRHHNLKNNK